MAEIRWYGHNCFRIKGKEATIYVDPVARATGYQMGKQNADIVTFSGAGAPEVDPNMIRPGYQSINGPGEYEISDVFVTGVRTYADNESGKRSGYNTVYLYEIESIKIGHLGNLGHALSEDQAEELKEADILLVPAGGGSVLDPERMASVVTDLTPKIVIPMRFRTTRGDKDLADADVFCKQLGTDRPAPEDKLVIRSSDLGETMRLVVLTPDS